jgi:hypothetical protein
MGGTGHAAQIGKMRNPHEIFIRNREEKRLLERGIDWKMILRKLLQK